MCIGGITYSIKKLCYFAVVLLNAGLFVFNIHIYKMSYLEKLRQMSNQDRAGLCKWLFIVTVVFVSMYTIIVNVVIKKGKYGTLIN